MAGRRTPSHHLHALTAARAANGCAVASRWTCRTTPAVCTHPGRNRACLDRTGDPDGSYRDKSGAVRGEPAGSAGRVGLPRVASFVRLRLRSLSLASPSPSLTALASAAGLRAITPGCGPSALAATAGLWRIASHVIRLARSEALRQAVCHASLRAKPPCHASCLRLKAAAEKESIYAISSIN